MSWKSFETIEQDEYNLPTVDGSAARFFLKPRKAQVFFGSAYRFIHISIHTVQTNTKPTVNKKTLVQTVMCKRQSERDGFFLNRFRLYIS